MAYTKQVWRDSETGGTPITAARLNHMEDGIEENSQNWDSISLVDFLYTEKLSKQVSVPGGGGASFSLSITPKSGYKPLGVIGWWCSNWEVQVPRLIVNDNGQEVSGGLYNTYSGSLNPTIEAVVLFVKDE